MPSFRTLCRVTALTLVLALSLAPMPTAALQKAGVSAPAPQSRVWSPDRAYRAAALTLEEAGLDAAAIHTLWNRLALSGQSLPECPLTGQAVACLQAQNCQTDRMERYLALWAAQPDLTADGVVEWVNMDLDRPFYEGIAPIADPADPLVLVNKYHALPADYVPELEALGRGYGSGSMTPQAAAAFRAMADAARAEGLTLKSVSAYRSYRTQISTHNRYLSQYSQALVDTFSARPGHSEHQTGLALDINVARISAHFENTAEFAWLQANCARFGFILRYPQGKDAITGYRFEPWHYRYVGPEAAAACAEQGLTWEEYCVPQEPALPDLSLGGTSLTAEVLLLDGVPYLPLPALSAALQGTLRCDHHRAVLEAAGHILILSPGYGARLDSRYRRLSSPVLRLEGEFYIAWEDIQSLFAAI